MESVHNRSHTNECPVQLESAPCPLGCPPAFVKVLRGRDRLHDLPGEFSVIKCLECGLLRTDPRPTSETIGYYYPQEYLPYMAPELAPDAHLLGANHAGIFTRQWLRQFLQGEPKALPELPPGRVLELGCAAGADLLELQHKGWDAHGIEYSQEATEKARALGLSVQCGTVEMAPDPEKQFDLIVAWMVMEHLHDPVKVLKKLWQWTKPKGWLVFTVPSADFLPLKIFSSRWYDLHLPNHLYHFRPDNIDKLLELSGWHCEKIKWHKNASNYFQSLKYLASDRGNHSLAGTFQAIATGQQWPYFRVLAGFVLGAIRQSGRITVWAKKK